MKIVIHNVNIVMPHREEVWNHSSVVIDNGLIAKIDRGIRYRYDYTANMWIDGEEGYLIPGLINHHTHGVSLGPLFPSAHRPLPLELVFRNLDRHLLQGTTTILNNDGFAIIEEVEIINKLHPIKIKTATSHTPLNIKAAELADGSGLTSMHKSLTVEDMLARGAIAIGEIGGGHTLAGGGVIYLEIPRAIEERTGKRITPEQAAKLKDAVLGRYADPSSLNRGRVLEALRDSGLENLLTVDEAIEIVMKNAYSSVEVAREGIKEAAELSLKHDVPIIVHTAPPSKKVVLELSKTLKSKLIAAHVNHPTFEEDEMIETARKLREYNTIIDICTGDVFKARQLYNKLDATLKMLREGLGDLISTDFMGGNWDPILMLIKKAIEENILSLPKAIAMATYNVVKAIPKIAPNSGVIDVGRTADLVVVDADDISKVKYVLINGIPVVINGEIRVPSFRRLVIPQ